MRWLFNLLVLLLVVSPGQAADRRTSVILILADDLGYGELGCYGQSRILTPHLDRMAREGMRFTQFYAGSPVCAPSRCCLLTGKHGGHAWVDNRSMKPEGQIPLPDGEVTLSELVKREGHATGAIGKWGLGPPGSGSDPTKRGFDLFFGYNCQAHAHYHYPTYLWRNDRRVNYPDNAIKTGKRHSHDLFEKEALAFLDANRERSFFLFLPLTIPHVSIQAEADWLAPYEGKWDDPAYNGKKGYLPHPAPRAAYAAMITRMDQTVGRILEWLKQNNRDRDTLVLFTSDNGATHDVGGADTEFFRSVGDLRGRKGSGYEGGLRVPLIARWPGVIKPGSESGRPAYFPDVLPTIMEVVGAGERIPAGVDGLSLLPTLRGKSVQKEHNHLVWEFAGYGGQQAIRMGNWKGIRRQLAKGPARLELYDLALDPSEKEDVSSSHPDVVRKLETVLAREHTPSSLFPLKGLDGVKPGSNDR
ncbi:MAG: arylsulfatase [Gemmataceae bacterium]